MSESQEAFLARLDEKVGNILTTVTEHRQESRALETRVGTLETWRVRTTATVVGGGVAISTLFGIVLKLYSLLG